MVVYKISLRCSMEPLFDSVKKFTDEINEIMGGFGFNEKVQVTSLLPVTVSVSRELTEEEITELRLIIVNTMKEKFDYVNIESIEKTIK